MSRFTSYYVYDYRRDATVHEFDAASDFAAHEEFSEWYNLLIRPDRWEKRRLGRYWLFARQALEDGTALKPRPLSVDENVRLDAEYFFLSVGPAGERDLALMEAEFTRLDEIDARRLLGRPANVFAEYLDDGKRSSS